MIQLVIQKHSFVEMVADYSSWSRLSLDQGFPCICILVPCIKLRHTKKHVVTCYNRDMCCIQIGHFAWGNWGLQVQQVLVLIVELSNPCKCKSYPMWSVITRVFIPGGPARLTALMTAIFGSMTISTFWEAEIKMWKSMVYFLTRWSSHVSGMANSLDSNLISNSL